MADAAIVLRCDWFTTMMPVIALPAVVPKKASATQKYRKRMTASQNVAKSTTASVMWHSEPLLMPQRISAQVFRTVKAAISTEESSIAAKARSPRRATRNERELADAICGVSLLLR